MPEHTHRVVDSHSVHKSMHGQGLAGRFNAASAQHISNLLSSMWFFWFCLVLDLMELPSVFRASQIIIWVAYLSQTVIQLLALPALGASGKLISQLQDEQARAQGETLQATHDLLVEVREINNKQMEILEKLETDGSQRV